MKILFVHNCYGKESGEEIVVKSNMSLLKSNGVDVDLYTRSSAELHGIYGQVKGFICGIWNPFSYRAFTSYLETSKPDIVHIHNLYPLINPQIITACKKKKIPVAMTVHNYRLICPNGLCLSKGDICHECFETKWREFACIKNNCNDSRLKSIGYAIRNYKARIQKFYHLVDIFFLLSDFQKKILVSNGYSEKKMLVLGNSLPETDYVSEEKGYVLYIGRISKEKGIDTLIYAARQLSNVSFIIAGSGNTDLLNDLPANVKYVGFVNGENKRQLIQQASIIVLTSKCYEGFPVVILEAMRAKKPMIVPQLGAMSEIAGDSAQVFEAGNVLELVNKISNLMSNKEKRLEMGEKGKNKFLLEYRDEVYVEKIINAYGKLIVTKE